MQTGPLLYDHDRGLTLLAVAVGVFASFTALELAARIRAAQTGTRRAWLVGAALALGGAIWSACTIATLALNLDPPPRYDAGYTVLSLLLAMLGSGAGLWLACRPQVRSRSLIAGGAIVGLGIAASDFTDQAALRMGARIDYDPLPAAFAVLVGVAGAAAALWLAARRQG